MNIFLSVLSYIILFKWLYFYNATLYMRVVILF